jgi:hypothetical protein
MLEEFGCSLMRNQERMLVLIVQERILEIESNHFLCEEIFV